MSLFKKKTEFLDRFHPIYGIVKNYCFFADLHYSTIHQLVKEQEEEGTQKLINIISSFFSY